MDTAEADLLISTSHCVAKGLKPQKGTRHLCYCFTPMRYAWLFYDEYFGNNPLKKIVLSPMLTRLRAWDHTACEHVDRFVTLSRHVQKRIQDYYGREADVVYPFVNRSYWTPTPALCSGTTHGRDMGTYDLIVSALAPYKRIDLAVKAYIRSGYPLIIVGTGTEFPRLRALASQGRGTQRRNIEFIGWASDERIRELYRLCRTLVFPGEEDFGIVPLEAQACGRPVVAYARGGALETVIEGKTGVFFHEQTPEALLEAVERCAALPWKPEAIRANTERFSKEQFIQGLSESIRKCLMN